MLYQLRGHAEYSFEISSLGLEVSAYLSSGEECASGSGSGRYNLKTNPSAKSQGVVVICKKEDTHGIVIDANALAEQEKRL